MANFSLAVFALVAPSAAAFSPPHHHFTTTTTQQRSLKATELCMSSRVKDTTAAMREMREQMAGDDETALFMQALRGQNLNDDDRASLSTVVRLVEIGGEGQLPYDYDPKALKEFFRTRPLAVLTRIAQVASVGGGYAFGVFVDKLTGKLDDPEREVQRASELRELFTSLGPFFIK